MPAPPGLRTPLKGLGAGPFWGCWLASTTMWQGDHAAAGALTDPGFCHSVVLYLQQVGWGCGDWAAGRLPDVEAIPMLHQWSFQQCSVKSCGHFFLLTKCCSLCVSFLCITSYPPCAHKGLHARTCSKKLPVPNHPMHPLVSCSPPHQKAGCGVEMLT